eukprot:6593798-Pyramimonas_sp.AAC.1
MTVITPIIEQWNQHLKEQDITRGLLRTRSPTMKHGDEGDSGLATIVGNVARTHIGLGAPSAKDAVTKINYATENLEREIHSGYYVKADKTHHLVGLRGSGAQATTRRVPQKKYVVKCEVRRRMGMLGQCSAADGISSDEARDLEDSQQHRVSSHHR